MKLTIKIVSILVLVALASPVVTMHGCGQVINGGQCGGCPDTTAPSDATAKSLKADVSATVTAGDSPCWSHVVFQFFASDKVTPLNNICVEISTNGLISEPNPAAPGACDSHSYSASYLRARTDATGTVVLDFAAPSVPASPPVYFVQADSCAVGATWKATITVQ